MARPVRRPDGGPGGGAGPRVPVTGPGPPRRRAGRPGGGRRQPRRRGRQRRHRPAAPAAAVPAGPRHRPAGDAGGRAVPGVGVRPPRRWGPRRRRGQRRPGRPGAGPPGPVGAVRPRPPSSLPHPPGLPLGSSAMVSELFDADAWQPVDGFDFTDITYHRAVDQGTVRVAFDRPDVRNAFRPHTVDELCAALDHARQWADVGCVLLTGNGPSPKDGGWAFCSGGDQRIRGRDGYQYDESAAGSPAVGRLHILEAQRLIRFMPKVVICVVPGWAAGGGHSLHVVSDLTLASAE